MAPSSSRRQLFAGLAAALLLAGCQGRPPLPPLPEPPRDTVRPATAGNPNRVALLVPLTGADGGVATSIANAANLALLDSGERAIRLTTYDSGKLGAAEAASRAIAEGNKLILGPLLSSEARAVGPVARRAGVPVIAFSNDSAVAGDGVFVMGVVPEQAVERVVRYARDRRMARFGALVPDNLYGRRVSQAFMTAVQRSGGRMAGSESYGGSSPGLRVAATSLNARGGADAVLLADSGRTSAQAAALVRPAAQILGTELWGNDRTLGQSAALRGAWYAAVPNARFDQLVARYRNQYGKTPYRLGSLGYDAVLLAVRTNRYWSSGARFPAHRLIDREGFAGIDGIFRFGRDGIAERALEVRRVTASGSTVLSPAPTSFVGR